MTTQKAYERIRAWFLRPGAVFGFDREEGNCVYRGGSKPYSRVRCAVGCLIPPKNYTDQLEGMGPHQLVIYELPDLFAGINVKFLEQAQTLHDNEACKVEPSIPNFIAELDKLARQFKLEVVS